MILREPTSQQTKSSETLSTEQHEFELIELITCLSGLTPKQDGYTYLSELIQDIETQKAQPQYPQRYQHNLKLIPQLIKKQFGDPALEWIRELGSNGFDAHGREDNLTTPVQIRLNPHELICQDQGDGMGLDELIKFLVPGLTINGDVISSVENATKNVTGRFGQGVISLFYPLIYDWNHQNKQQTFYSLETGKNNINLTIDYEKNHKAYQAKFNATPNDVSVQEHEALPIAKQINVITQRQGQPGLRLTGYVKAGKIKVVINQCKSELNKGTKISIQSPLIQQLTSKSDRIKVFLEDVFEFVDNTPLLLNKEQINFSKNNVIKGKKYKVITVPGGKCYFPDCPEELENKYQQGSIKICENGKKLISYTTQGNVYTKVVLSFERIVLTPDRASMNFEDEKLKVVVERIISEIFANKQNKLSAQQQVKLANSLALLITPDNFNLSTVVNKQLKQLMANKKHFVGVYDKQQLMKLDISNCFYINDVLLDDLTLPKINIKGSIYYLFENLISANHERCLSIKVKDERYALIHKAIVDVRESNKEKEYAYNFNIKLLEKILKLKTVKNQENLPKQSKSLLGQATNRHHTNSDKLLDYDFYVQLKGADTKLENNTSQETENIVITYAPNDFRMELTELCSRIRYSCNTYMLVMGCDLLAHTYNSSDILSSLVDSEDSSKQIFLRAYMMNIIFALRDIDRILHARYKLDLSQKIHILLSIVKFTCNYTCVYQENILDSFRSLIRKESIMKSSYDKLIEVTNLFEGKCKQRLNLLEQCKCSKTTENEMDGDDYEVLCKKLISPRYENLNSQIDEFKELFLRIDDIKHRCALIRFSRYLGDIDYLLKLNKTALNDFAEFIANACDDCANFFESLDKHHAVEFIYKEKHYHCLIENNFISNEKFSKVCKTKGFALLHVFIVAMKEKETTYSVDALLNMIIALHDKFNTIETSNQLLTQAFTFLEECNYHLEYFEHLFSVAKNKQAKEHDRDNCNFCDGYQRLDLNKAESYNKIFSRFFKLWQQFPHPNQRPASHNRLLRMEYINLLEIYPGISDELRPFVYTYVLGTDVNYMSENHQEASHHKLMPLCEDPNLIERLGTKYLAQQRIKRAICQRQNNPYFWISEMVKNAKEAGAKKLKIALHTTDKKDMLVVVLTDDGKGMDSQAITALKIPGMSAGKKIDTDNELDQNYGWGFFSALKYFDVIKVVTSHDGKNGIQLTFVKKGDEVSFEQTTLTGSFKQGTQFICYKNNCLPNIEYILIYSNMLASLRFFNELDISFQNRPLAPPKNLEKIVVQLQQQFIEDGVTKGELKVDICSANFGVFYNNIKTADIPQKYMQIIPGSIRKLFETYGIRIFLPLMGQNMNRSHIISNENLEQAIALGIIRACIKFCCQQLLQTSFAEHMSDDYWYRFQEQFYASSNEERDIINILKISSDNTICTPKLLQAKDNLKKKIREYFEALKDIHSIDTVRINKLSGVIDSTSQEHLLDNITTCLNDPAKLALIVTHIQLDENLPTFMQVRQTLQKHLIQENILISDTSLKYNSNYITSQPNEVDGIIDVIFNDLTREYTDARLLPILDKFKKTITQHIRNIQDQKSIQSRPTSSIRSPILAHFLKQAAKKIWNKKIIITYVSEKNGTIAHTSRNDNTVYVNTLSEEYQQFIQIVYKPNFDLTQFINGNKENIVDWLKTLAHELQHQEEDSDCLSTHDPQFYYNLARKLDACFLHTNNISALNNVVNLFIDSFRQQHQGHIQNSLFRNILETAVDDAPNPPINAEGQHPK